MKTIGIICGSLRRDSYNKIIVENFAKLEDSVTYKFISIGDLPLFNEDLGKGEDPKAVQQFKFEIEQVDGLLIVSPEYNGGIPGVLKNALDWASRPAKTSVLYDKKVGIIGATPGGMGTAFAQMQLRQSLEQIHVQVLPFRKMLISQVHEKVDVETRTITDEKTLSYIQRYLQQLIDWMND